MKRMTQKSLRNFAESLTSAIEEVADKIGTIESILNGGDEVDGEDDYTAEEPVVEEPAVEDTATPEEPVVEETTVPTEEAPAEEPTVDEGVAPEAEADTEQFSEKRYESVKDFLSRNVNF